MNEMPTPEAEADEIVQDARSERRLLWQALVSLVIVAAVVVVREMFLR
ncbi:hypothetical protein [Microbacterium sp. NPDC087665]